MPDRSGRGEERALRVLHDRAGSGRSEPRQGLPEHAPAPVLKDLGDAGVTTSICPMDTSTVDLPQGPGWGYNPNMAALVGHLKDRFAPLCLPRPFDVEDSG